MNLDTYCAVLYLVLIIFYIDHPDKSILFMIDYVYYFEASLETHIYVISRTFRRSIRTFFLFCDLLIHVVCIR
jgi:hypothetical protein